MACGPLKLCSILVEPDLSRHSSAFPRRIPVVGSTARRLSTLFFEGERGAPLALVLLVLYATFRAVVTCVSSPLTFDDIFTINMARQPGLAALLRALWHGVDSQPPLFDLVERVGSLMPKAEVGYRLPSVVAFDGMLICVYEFVRHRAGGVAGVVCAALLLLTPLYTSYATAARPYCLAAACIAAALLAYQRASSRRWIVLMALALAAADCLHYLSIFAIIPMAATEMIRSRRARSIRIGVWAALVAGAAPLAVFWPLLAHFRQVFGGHFWAKPTAAALYHLFGNSLGLPGFWGFAVVALCACALLEPLVLPRRGQENAEAAAADGGAEYDRILVFFVLVSPLIYFAAARLFHGPFDDRYIVSSMLAFPLALGLILITLNRRMALALALLVLCALASNEASFWHAESANFFRTPSPAAEAEEMIDNSGYAGLPVVISDSHDYLQITWYASPPLKSRLVWTADPAEADKYAGFDTDDRNLPLLATVADLKVRALRSYIATHAEFLLYWAPGGEHGWLPGVLARDGCSVTVLTSAPDHFLFLVSRSGNALKDVQEAPARPEIITSQAAPLPAS